MQYKRNILNKIINLLQHFPVIVLTGARQTGKTTLLRTRFPDYNYVSLDLPSDALLAEEDPDVFLEKYPPPLIIDEVQYAPILFRHLKVFVDKNRDQNGKMILTGSQKFNLMKEISDSLAGRCAILELETLSINEIGSEFFQRLSEKPLTFPLTRGGFPQLWKDSAFPELDFFRSYMATYLERDVRQILNISSLRDFDRFIRACAVRSGQLLNKSEIAKEVGVTPKTANDWLSVLEASNQITLLEPYFANIGKRMVKSPKIYFNDTGMLSFLLGLNIDSLGDSYLLGAVWETYVFSELRKNILSNYPESTIWFYRDQSCELDFLLSHKGKLHFCECKWTEFPDKKSISKFSEIKMLFKNAAKTSYVICRTPENYPLDDQTKAINGYRLAEWIESL